jgi:predicted RNase H-like HicB family nuclease
LCTQKNRVCCGSVRKVAGVANVMRYVVYVESKSEEGYRAYVPDLPGVVADAGTREEAVSRIREGISAHDGVRSAGKGLRRATPTELVTVNLA